MLHGPVSIVDSGFPVIAFASADEVECALANVADEIAAKGAMVFATSIKVSQANVLPVIRTGHALTTQLPLSQAFSLWSNKQLRHVALIPTPPPPQEGDRNSMTGNIKAYVGAQIHDGRILHDNHALVVSEDGRVRIGALRSLPPNCCVDTLNGGLITPGFVDLQVNDGGGVMFNDYQSVAALRKIAKAHAPTGTRTILPTLITDTPNRTRAAICAVEQAISEKVSGIVGIHFEGPHLSIARKGAHDPKLIRTMTDDNLSLMLGAAERLPNVMVTVADSETCHAAFDAGAQCVTHLFNAMSQLGNSEPGLVGATMERGDIFAVIIADGIHVHPTTIGIALAAKPQSDENFSRHRRHGNGRLPN